MVIVDLARFQHRQRVPVQRVEQFQEQPHQLLPRVPGFEVVRHVLLRLRPRQWQHQPFHPVLRQLRTVLLRAFQPRLVRVVQQHDVLEAIDQLAHGLRRDDRGLRVEADGVEAVRRQRQHVLLAAREEEQVALRGQLLQPEAVVVARVPAIDEAHLRHRAIDLHAPFPPVPEHRFRRGGTEAERLALPRLAPVLGERYRPVAAQHLHGDARCAPVDKLPLGEGLLRRPVGLRFGTVGGHSRLFRVRSGFPGTAAPCARHEPQSPTAPGSHRPVGRAVPVQSEAQLPVDGVQHLHEVGGVPAVQPFQLRHEEEAVSRIVPVAEVLHPVRTAPAVVIHVARSLAVGVQRVQEVPAHPPLHGQVVAEHVQPVTGSCQHFFLSYHSFRFFGYAGDVPLSSGRSWRRVSPPSTAHAGSRPPAGDSVSAARSWNRE